MKQVDPPNSRDIIIATIAADGQSKRPDWLADKILKALAAKDMHIMKYRAARL